MELCKALGVQHVEIESDSMVVVQAIKHHRTDNWRYTYVLRQCMELWKDVYKIRHVLCQANKAADRSADWAHIHKSRRECYTEMELPSFIRSELKEDIMGLWSYRK